MPLRALACDDTITVRVVARIPRADETAVDMAA
jgi:hypothetical protein